MSTLTGLDQRVNSLAVVLKTTPLGEADLCVELFTEQVGRARVVARGALKSKRRYMGTLELGALIKVDYQPKLHTLATLGPCDVVSSPWRARSDLPRLATLCYALELVQRASPLDAPDPALFESIVELLQSLEGPEGLSPLGLVAWELALFDHLGYALRIDRCPLTGLAPNALSALEGGAVHNSAVKQSWPVPTQALRTLYMVRSRRAQGSDLTGLNFSSEELYAVRVAFSSLWAHLCHHPLKSHPFLMQVLQLTPSQSSSLISPQLSPQLSPKTGLSHALIEVTS